MSASDTTISKPIATPLLDGLASSKDPTVRVVGKIAKHAGGRPTSLTIPIARIIIREVMAGNYLRTACASAGVTKRTLDNWRSRAREVMEDPEVMGLDEVPETERLYVEFFLAFQVAEGRAEAALLKRATRGDKGWQAAMTVLERRHPEYWGRKETHTHEGGERPIVIEHTVGDETRRRGVASVLEKSGALEGSATEAVPEQPQQAQLEPG